MDYIDLDGQLIEEETGQDRLLTFLYTNAFGRMLLKPLVQPGISRLSGRVLSSRISRHLVNRFIKKEGIDMRDFPKRNYTSFNDFFTRVVKEGARPIDPDENALISPCDCRAQVFPILNNSNFSIKHTEYTLRSLLHSRRLAKRFQGGYLYVLRLTVTDYHRYVYAASGDQSKMYRIEGSFHTVNPIANDYLPIYKENTREYTLLHTDTFGDVLQMEVGALLVGKIKNLKDSCYAVRGEEKGYFEYGGSTIIVITEPGAVIPREDLLNNTANGLETKLMQGQAIGHKEASN
ncbi:MAG: phosphatidylserine decarboxylase [Eubacterium sp.]|nr:phosphatidylserine decarboxylase [Eubacterium sp.]